MRFHCSADQQPQPHTDSQAWQEGPLDDSLCRAGLW